jgi:dihydropteroate synthase
MLKHSIAPRIMGILNATPDSFSDGGCYNSLEAALAQVNQMVEDGADIIDVGGESTRPGSEPVDPAEQIQRVVPLISEIRARFPSLCVSVDTASAKVADAALKVGANTINDVTAGLGDTDMFAVAVEYQCSIILMHMQGRPKTMQDNPYYQDPVAEITSFLQGRIAAALSAGIGAERITIDPGIGFGKRKEDNLTLLAHLDAFVALGYPVLLGTSRKRFMGSVCNIAEPRELVTATAVTTALGVMAGVAMFRVHDIKANRQAADVAWAIKQSS